MAYTNLRILITVQQMDWPKHATPSESTKARSKLTDVPGMAIGSCELSRQPAIPMMPPRGDEV